MRPCVAQFGVAERDEKIPVLHRHPTHRNSFVQQHLDAEALFKRQQSQQEAAFKEMQRLGQEQLQAAVARLRALPPLVTSWEIEALKAQLAEAASGQRLLLQGGDCAESFDECSSDSIAGKLKVLLQMSLVMVHGTRRPVVRVGRFAGQYAKPRSKDTETKDGVELPCYRGDNVNGPAFTAEDRTPNPWRLVKGHERAALTLNFIRSIQQCKDLL